MNVTHAKMTEGGRIVISAEYRKALGLKVGDKVVLRLEDGGVPISTLDTAIRRAQEFVRQYVPEGYSLVDELIADRRAEAERE